MVYRMAMQDYIFGYVIEKVIDHYVSLEKRWTPVFRCAHCGKEDTKPLGDHTCVLIIDGTASDVRDAPLLTERVA